ncbi:MAG: MFS transporter [Pantoea sp.]|uniref:MFS transporter n=1 Tax=Pantoea sp. TaxID=69393 RepID=UPI0023998DB4|nr:MFS transporter [Pantoea sp.]MDE1188146.1 MFS transporter [Pantoea sp.]
MAKAAHASHSVGMTKSLTLLFSIAGGIAVGNLYWVQPLLDYIGNAFHVSYSHAGLLVTLTQIGYALGVLLLVPLGDSHDRRRLIPAIMAVSALALIACAFAPTFSFLLASLFFVGLTTVTGQLLIPLAGDLAADHQRGKIVGTVVSGVLTGILASRTVSGLVADAFGWRAIYVLAALMTLALALILLRSLPADQKRAAGSYPQLLGSIITVVRQHPTVQVTLVLGAIGFSVFTLFWTGLTFLLSSAPYGYSASQIGLVGLVGLAGALAARRAGRLHDRGWSAGATGGALLLVMVSLIIAEIGGSSIFAILAAVLLLDIAIQATNVLNQTRLFAVDVTARSRLNTAFVVSNFIGGAIGSSLAGTLWQLGGWSGITAGEMVLTGCALLIWLVQRKRLTVLA